MGLTFNPGRTFIVRPMSTYTIGQVADRTGFTTSALRYYESRGLVSPATRTDSGYRVYDDHAVARLAFIARAKQLGCSLEEIMDLAAIWDGEHCGPVQRRFHELVTAKIDQAHSQMAELAAFASQLQTAAAQLAGPAVDGPCDESCACAAGSGPDRVAAKLASKPDGPPIACTLDVEAMPDRLADWKSILGHASARQRTADGALRVEFASDVLLSELTRLVAAEQSCCAFLSFAITVDQRGIGLEVGGPEGAEELVTAMFGSAA